MKYLIIIAAIIFLGWQAKKDNWKIQYSGVTTQNYQYDDSTEVYITQFLQNDTICNSKLLVTCGAYRTMNSNDIAWFYYSVYNADSISALKSFDETLKARTAMLKL